MPTVVAAPSVLPSQPDRDRWRMRLLLCGDVVGRTGRAAVTETMPRLRRELALDFVIVNGENAAGGFGISDKICQEFYEVGVDVVTTGNHVWDRREIIPYIPGDPQAAPPGEFPQGHAGQRQRRLLDIRRTARPRRQPHGAAVHGPAR